jgi:hypothetical protein
MKKSSSQTVTHDILVVIDALTILTKYPKPSTDPDNPTSIMEPEKIIYFITRKENTSVESGLTIMASPSDTLRWRSMTLAGTSGSTLQWYKYAVVIGENLFASPTMQTYDLQLPVPNPSDPLHPQKFQTIIDYYWSVDICNSGTTLYNICFSLTNRRGILHGYFQCKLPVKIVDPQIIS